MEPLSKEIRTNSEGKWQGHNPQYDIIIGILLICIVVIHQPEVGFIDQFCFRVISGLDARQEKQCIKITINLLPVYNSILWVIDQPYALYGESPSTLNYACDSLDGKMVHHGWKGVNLTCSWNSCLIEGTAFMHLFTVSLCVILCAAAATLPGQAVSSTNTSPTTSTSFRKELGEGLSPKKESSGTKCFSQKK